MIVMVFISSSLSTDLSATLMVSSSAVVYRNLQLFEKGCQ